MSIIIALFAHLLLAIVSVTDKYILTSEKVRPIVFAFYSAFPVLAIFLILPFYGQSLGSFFDFLIAIISGFAFALGVWVMYRGFLKSEVSHIGPLIGGLIPLFLLLFGQIFLREVLTGRALIGIFFLSFGTLAVAFEYKKRHYQLTSGIAWGVLAAVLFALSHVLAKYIYESYDFATGFIWTRGFMGVCGALFLLSPILRKDIFQHKKIVKKVKKSKRPVWIIFNKITAVVGASLVQYAIALGSVTIVNALAGVQFALLIILVFLLSKFWPKFFKEEYSRGEIIQEIVAVLLIAVGLILIV